MRKNLLMFSTTSWDAPHWFRRQHFARRLAQNGWRVFYVNPPHTLTTLLKTRRWRAAHPAFHRAVLRRGADGLPDLWVCTPPPFLPLMVRSPLSAVWSRRLVRGRLQRAARGLFGDEPFVQVLYHPCDRHLLRADLPAVYEIVDQFTGYPEYQGRAAWLAGEVRALAARADAVTATNARLAATVAPASPPEIVPNGVDLALYRGDAAPPPPELAALPRPRAVYVGALLEWFDFDLLAAVAARLPRVSFVLLGFHNAPLPPLPPNVRHLGSLPQRDLPRCLAACDAGIIPFRVNDLTLHVDPLKFYEYMAAGLPCVSTPMHALEPFRAPGVLSLAAAPDAFARGLEEAFATAPEGRTRRAAIAADHDWPVLARRFEQVLERVLDAHQRRHSGL